MLCTCRRGRRASRPRPAASGPAHPIRFDASGAWDKETPLEQLRFEWWVDGAPAGASGPRAEWTFDDRARHEVTVWVYDGLDAARSTLAVDLAPVAAARPATPAVQVLGSADGARSHIALEVEAPEGAAGEVRYRWLQREGPSLSCAARVEGAGRCEEAPALSITTASPRVELRTTRAGYYRFEVSRVEDGAPSAPVEVWTEALYTRASVVPARMDFANSARLDSYPGWSRLGVAAELGTRGLRAEVGLAVAREAGDTSGEIIPGGTAGLSLRLLDALAGFGEIIDPSRVPRYAVAWSPGVDVLASARVTDLWVASALTDLPTFNVDVSLGPQINLGRRYLALGPAATLCLISCEALDPWRFGLAIQGGFRIAHASDALTYLPTGARLERIEEHAGSL